jgi:REP element-mobilizing transposase RayT
MTRPLRLHAPGVWHHVFARGNEKGCIFADDADCRSFLKLLAQTLPRFNVRCVAYCLLWNHYHLLLVPAEHPISKLLQQLNSAYCQGFNRRHNRVGHLLQGRFGCRIVESGDYARTALRYLAFNPVAAGRATKPEEWPWSSYCAALGLEERDDVLCLEEVWKVFGTADATVGRARLAAFIAAGFEDVLPNSLLHGSSRLRDDMASALEPHQTIRDFVYPDRFAARPTLGSLLDVDADQLAVEDAARDAFHKHAYTLAEIAAKLTCDPSTVCRWIQRAQRRRSAVAGPSPMEDIRAKNKI